MDILMYFFNFFCQSEVIIAVLIGGYFWISPAIFREVIYLTLINTFYNYLLKNIFQLPLAPHLNKPGSYAFPSGHMQMASVAYGWLAFRFKQPWLIGVIAILLVGLSLSIVYLGFHNYYDVAGSIIFALLLMIAFYYLIKEFPVQFPWILLGIASVCLIIFHYMNISVIAHHIWLAYYALIGFSIGEHFFGKYHNVSLVGKLLSTVIFVAALALIKTIFSMENIAALDSMIYEMHWLFIGFMLPFSNYLAQTAGQKLKLH